MSNDHRPQAGPRHRHQSRAAKYTAQHTPHVQIFHYLFFYRKTYWLLMYTYLISVWAVTEICIKIRNKSLLSVKNIK